MSYCYARTQEHKDTFKTGAEQKLNGWHQLWYYAQRNYFKTRVLVAAVLIAIALGNRV